MTSALRERYVRAQLEGNRAGAVALVNEALASGLSVAEIHLQIVQAAQYEIGQLWEANSISIALEHQATAISQLVLAHLYERLPRAPANGRCVLIACVEGELHDMGSRIGADFLETAGFEVRLLGANVPAASLAERVQLSKPDLLALSATMSYHLPSLQKSVQAVRATTHGQVPILVGGRAFTWSSGAASQLDVQGYAADAPGLIAEALRLTGVTAQQDRSA